MNYSAFQSNAFQRNAFQITSGGEVAPQDTVLGGKAVFGQWPGIQGSNWTPEDYEKAFYNRQAQLKKKQERVIEVKLEAQEIVLKKRELANENDKQSQRQLAALEKKLSKLDLENQKLLQAINDLQAHRDFMVQRDNDALAALILSDPFFMIGGGMH